MQLKHTLTPTFYENGVFKAYVLDTGNWTYNLPSTYDKETDSWLPDSDYPEIIYFDSPFAFSVGVYSSCLKVSTIYRYGFLYKLQDLDSLRDFRQTLFNIISIFGGTEVLYLTDQGNAVLSDYLCNWVEEGASYASVKQDVICKGIPLLTEYTDLDENRSLRASSEIILDDFQDLKSN
ncbi:hypothetical protein ACFPH8_11215 [Bizionia hallyeonensis]|uniref:Uncharacterized protein n=1 Tax=Bizionia hallyeonensis TaxID=1123757 RepID=A0ABW0C863_9FLAO